MSVNAWIVAGPWAMFGGTTLPGGRVELVAIEIVDTSLGEVMIELGRYVKTRAVPMSVPAAGITYSCFG